MSDHDPLYRAARKQLEARLSEYRLLHSISVSDLAVTMAERYGTNVDDARMAGLLHDWDKNLSDEELISRAKEFGIELLPRQEDLAALLHAQTGAVAVARAFPSLPPQVIQAIGRHTSAAPNMTELDMIIYVADMIEPLRSQGNLTPLRTIVGKVPLEVLFLKSFEMSMEHLIKRHRFIHPDSLEVWNTYIARERNK
ncbi:MAG: bis(5'-nucleosyl)-tetraphosphatase (symmetrical) YqeK [Coriobacteriales bacterium]|jgi:predicted HD superfamily hydrolase involved in NAD metabolism|nr:bis(5'-nucleosyl)-tetraphosphatase (symmetrical) YqeK [Coriobacteriales bacterium]